jgi:hypothetical protein
MAKRSLRPQLNQIRAWVRQGRTDAWIAHQLEIGTAELREFRRQHGLSQDDEDGTGEVDLRDEIEAEIAEASAAEETEDEPEAGEAEAPQEGGEEPEPDGGEAEGRPRRRRRRGRRGGRARRKPDLEATFEQGEEGYGLWLDPAVQDDPAFAEHWAGQREVTVRFEPEQIVIRRAGPSSVEDAGEDD